MKHLLSRILIAVILLQTPMMMAQHREDIDPARRAFIASRLYQATYQYFAHWGDAVGLDVDDAYAEYLREALSAPDRRMFSLASQAFLVKLGNGHTRFIDDSLSATAGSAHGYSVRYLEGDWTVTESHREGLRVGDVITAIDGTPIDEFYADRMRYLNASTERYRRRSLFYWWHRFLFPLQYTVSLADGRSVEVDRTVRLKVPRLESTGRLLGNGTVAYLRIPSWDNPRFQERALELVREYASVPGMIIDIRGNNGGSTPIAMMNALMDRPWKWWTESTPMSFAFLSYNAKQGRAGYSVFERPSMIWSEGLQDGDSLYTGDLVILVDEGSHSASEDFTQPFKENGRATIIGNTTAGSTGQPYSEKLGDGMSFRIGTKREHFPDGSRFEGIGIAPDVRIVPRAQDLQEGRDPELERALEILGHERSR